MQSILDQDYRKQIIDEILGTENIERKKESYRRSEIFNKRQAPFIVGKLKQEFEAATVEAMRKITSINIAERIVNKMAPLYEKAPERSFTVESGTPISEDQAGVVSELYAEAKANVKLLKANRVLKYQQQCILQVVPVLQKGIIDIRVLQPHHVDVVPMDSDPEAPFAYIISSYDRSNSLLSGNSKDERIADVNDSEKKKREQMRLVWWTAEHNMITNGLGEIVQEDPTKIENPIGELPFIDISDNKENEFWVRKGSNIIDFAIDFSVVLSDTANTNRLQSYAQGVIRSVEKPKDTRVGPNQFIWLQLNPNDGAVQPDLAFANPNPDMQASIEFLDVLINYFMTAEGVDPKTIQSKGQGKSFSSGFERLLSMLEEFSAASDDAELFKHVEDKLMSLMLKWHKAYSVPNSPLKQSLLRASLPESLYVQVRFNEPQMIQSKSEKEDSELKLLDKGLRSKVQALMKIDDIDEQEAINRLMQAKEHEEMFAQQMLAKNEEMASVEKQMMNDSEVEGVPA
jgi:hypothetical protein